LQFHGSVLGPLSVILVYCTFTSANESDGQILAANAKPQAVAFATDPRDLRAICGYFAVMRKITLVFIVMATTVAPAQANPDIFTPRLVVAIQNYLQAYEVCLRRVIAVSPVAGMKPEHIAATAIKTCRERDAGVRATRRRVYGFPSVDNFMAGTGDRIFAFSVKLAKAHIANWGLR
jgi:hypothetical protein